MKELNSIEKFLKDPGCDSTALTRICSSETLLAEALNNEQFVHVIAFYDNTNHRYYNPAAAVSRSILQFFPEKLLKLPGNYFLKLVCSITNIGTISHATLSEIANRLATVSCDKTTVPTIDVVVRETFFGTDCSVKDRCRIIENLASFCNEIELTLDNLDELFKHLSPESVTQVLPKCSLNLYADMGHQKAGKYLDGLPSASKDLILECMVSGKLGVHPQFLYSEYVRPEYFEKNADILSEKIASYELSDILGKRHNEFPTESVFILKSAIMRRNTTVKYLSSKNLVEYAKSIKPTAKIDWGMLLYNAHISEYPALFEKVVKAYCGLKSELDIKEINLAGTKIPDAIMLKLTIKEASTLVEKIKPEIHGLFFSPEPLKQILSPLAISDPVFYREHIVCKLQAIMSKHKTGATTYSRLLKYFGLGDPRQMRSLSDDNFLSMLNNAIDKSLSMSTKKIQRMAVRFICEMIEKKTLAEQYVPSSNDYIYAIEGKYKELLDVIGAEEKNNPDPKCNYN